MNEPRRREHPPLTQVLTSSRDGEHRYRILFGNPHRIEPALGVDGVTRHVVSFTAGSRFGVELWRRTPHRSTEWRCFVCEAAGPGMVLESVPFVTPEVRVLLSTRGAAQSRLFLAWLDSLTAQLDVLTCPPETFEAAHFRLHGSRAALIPPQRLSNRL